MIEKAAEPLLFHLQTAHTSYVIAYQESLQGLYWGPAVTTADAQSLLGPRFHSGFDWDIALEREEFPQGDGRTLGHTCVSANQPLNLQWAGYDIAGLTDGAEELRIYLKDAALGHQAELIYRVYPQWDIIARRVRFTSGPEGTTLSRLMSGAASLPDGRQNWMLHYTNGKWAGEFQRQTRPLSAGSFSLDSARGNSGPHFNPAFALSAPEADEWHGQVYFGLLAYTGNWNMTFEQTPFGTTRLMAGFRDEDFCMALAAGETVESPWLYLGCCEEGLGGMSRLLQGFERACLLPQAGWRKVLYNSWEATEFAVEARQQEALARRAAAMGVEMFVVDDGWFGQRNSDRAGLGDWFVNPDKFPDGLESLIHTVNQLGMDFGLWVEPEGVNPDSDLYRAHPDWIYRLPNRQPITLRNQYVLDLSLPQVERFVIDMLTRLLRQYNIRFIKWDMNRSIADLWDQADRRGRRQRHIAALYRIIDHMRAAFPQVEWEACSGGGSRVDLGMLSRMHQCWPSDNTDPFDRLFIQDGYSLFYPIQAMMCWVTDARRGSLRYKFHSAMCGSLGIGADIGKMTQEQMDLCREQIALYKQIRPIIQGGLLYRLLSPGQGPLSAVCYVQPDQSQAVALAFLHSSRNGDPCPRLRLAGLDPKARYQIVDTDQVYSGAGLMHIGLALPLAGDFDSCLIRLSRV